MTGTSSRLLQVVSLLASRPSWSAAEPAARMEVTERTVRRDIARLREIGYSVESDPGGSAGTGSAGAAGRSTSSSTTRTPSPSPSRCGRPPGPACSATTRRPCLPC
ncbi:helix-turn-helix domain-containing protein [Pseudonocardia sp. NPDC049154]|uniref:helix-turn-helix transcriptional regulator n=1 Tax=Pseudonocardia sp. NPDC049154 TaxID=3155501 RepID=UPI0033D17595